MSREENPVAYSSCRVLQSVCALIPSCNDQTSNSLVSVHQCHPWIGNNDTHSTRGFITESQSHTYYIKMSWYHNQAPFFPLPLLVAIVCHLIQVLCLCHLYLGGNAIFEQVQ